MPKVIKKKILTEDDLLKFCQEQKFAKFSSKDTGYQLALKVPKNNNIDKQIAEHDTLIKADNKAYKAYMKKANKVKLSQKLKEKVRNGDYDKIGRAHV